MPSPSILRNIDWRRWCCESPWTGWRKDGGIDSLYLHQPCRPHIFPFVSFYFPQTSRLSFDRGLLPSRPQGRFPASLSHRNWVRNRPPKLFCEQAQKLVKNWLRYESSTLILYKELSSSIFPLWVSQWVSEASVTPVQISILCNI